VLEVINFDKGSFSAFAIKAPFVTNSLKLLDNDLIGDINQELLHAATFRLVTDQQRVQNSPAYVRKLSAQVLHVSCRTLGRLGR